MGSRLLRDRHIHSREDVGTSSKIPPHVIWKEFLQPAPSRKDKAVRERRGIPKRDNSKTTTGQLQSIYEEKLGEGGFFSNKKVREGGSFACVFHNTYRCFVLYIQISYSIFSVFIYIWIVRIDKSNGVACSCSCSRYFLKKFTYI